MLLKQYQYTLLCILLLTLLSCKRDGETGPLQPISITTNISGRVVDDHNQPIQGVQLNAGGTTVVTDLNGSFNFSSVTVNADRVYVTAEKSGYFPGSRIASAKANSQSYVEIQLLSRSISGSFPAGNGGTVNAQNGGSVNIPANAVINMATGQTYSGIVNVAAYYLDPSAPGFDRQMPGDLRALSSSNEQRVLRSFGMMAVELTGASGEKLQIAPGKSASLSMPITSAQQSIAPASIPVWYFDEASGTWREEGTATRQGNTYTGSVSHFTFWNCDLPFPVVDLQATFKDQNGTPLPNIIVQIRIAGDPGGPSCFTDGNGWVKGWVPANTPLQLIAKDLCGNTLYNQNVGPFGVNTNLGVIAVTTAAQYSTTIAGTVTNCVGAPVNNGFVGILINGNYVKVGVTNGSYSRSIIACGGASTQVKLFAYDVSGNKFSDTTVLNVSSTANITSNLVACSGAPAEYMQWSIGTTTLSVIPPDTLQCIRVPSENKTYFITYTIGANRGIVTSFAGPAAPGTYLLDYLEVANNNQLLRNAGPMNVVINQYGNAVGQIVQGTISGTVKDSANASLTYPFSCSFKMKRDL